MSGKCRPSLRPKTLYNVDRSSLSTTDKECVHAVFELADHQKAEIEKNEKIIKAANDLIETQKAEIERLNALSNHHQTLINMLNEGIAEAKAEAIKEFAERLKDKQQTFISDEYAYKFIYLIEIDKLVKEMVGETE